MAADLNIEQSFFELNQTVKQAIDQRIATFFMEKKRLAREIDPLSRDLVDEIERLVRRGGKRIRPTLALVGYQAAGGEDMAFALDAALSLELLHAFMLVHDDVMDRDTKRHGKPNIVGVYERQLSRKIHPDQARQTAESMAIIAGDLLLSFVFEIIASLDVSNKLRAALIGSINQVTFETAAGQQLDVLFGVLGQQSLKKLLKVSHYKTAVYSFVAPLQFGVSLADAKQNQLSQLQSYGENLGMAFQLIDDVLGVFGSSRVTGKPVLSDLQEGKQTILRYWGFAFASSDQRKVLENCFGNEQATMADLRSVKKILIANGAQAKTLVMAQQYGDKAKAAINSDILPSQTKHQLMQLADFCLQRKF